jgi:glycerol-3-phosphate dehydrogenase (NAD(P)+)
MAKITVLGAGAWGSTMAQVLADGANDVVLWGRSEEVITEINTSHTNTKYLGSQVLPDSIKATSDIDEAFAHSKYIVLTIPTQSLREKLIELKPLFKGDEVIVSTLKGIEISTQMRMSEIIEEILPNRKIAVITGPNLADELILRQPAAAVIASQSPELAKELQEIFKAKYYRVYTSTDVMGCELAGAVKNVIALAVGIAIGLGFGENTQAMVITRGLNEVARLCAAHGSEPLTAAGLAGMGDLVATCGSPLSRNRTFGEEIGRSGSYENARQHFSRTVEGVASASAVIEVAHRVGVEVPIIEAVADLIKGLVSPQQAMDRLMKISTESENFIK